MHVLLKPQPAHHEQDDVKRCHPHAQHDGNQALPGHCRLAEVNIHYGHRHLLTAAEMAAVATSFPQEQQCTPDYLVFGNVWEQTAQDLPRATWHV